MDCKEYLKMLLITGFHNNSNPEIFKKDLAELEKNCPESFAKHTKTLVNNKNFSSYRYRDMEKLLATISADILLLDPDNFIFNFY